MRLEHAWTPQIQHEGDDSIMEALSQLGGVIKGEIVTLNIVRLYLRLVIITDLANSSGKHIPDGMMCGN